jgi:pantetheine-phosphate adenylyltransferase
MASLALYPGSFDPPTNGHADVIARASRLFERVIVAVLVNPSKRPWFTVEERAAMVKDACGGPRVDVVTFDGLVAELARRHGAATIIRGLRGASEFDYERQMALMNRHLNSDVDTVFLMPAMEFGHISSTLVKEVVSLGGSVAGLVPPSVAARLHQRREGGGALRQA